MSRLGAAGMLRLNLEELLYISSEAKHQEYVEGIAYKMDQARLNATMRGKSNPYPQVTYIYVLTPAIGTGGVARETALECIEDAGYTYEPE